MRVGKLGAIEVKDLECSPRIAQITPGEFFQGVAVANNVNDLLGFVGASWLLVFNGVTGDDS